MPTSPSKRTLAAILSTDVVDYSRLMSADDEATIALLKSCRALIQGRIRAHSGRVVNSVGDNLLAEFRSAVDAVASAIDIQQKLSEHNRSLPPERRMQFRVGIHLGEVIIEPDALYGDGVNIAARLESRAPSGGISVSGAIYEQVRNRPGLQFRDRGRRDLKNIPHPVPVYDVLNPGVPTPASGPELGVPGFSGRAAIAVLAFENRTGDPDQDFLGEGLAEDLIAQLSCQRRLPVIAPASSFVYRDRPPDLERIGSELGARYLVEGNVRRRGDDIRVRVRLSDVSSGQQLWAQRYDRALAKVLDLEEEISLAIATAIQPALASAEMQRVRQRQTPDLDAWEIAQRAEWHMRKMEPAELERAQQLYEEAARKDPALAFAWSGLSIVHLVAGLRGWRGSQGHALAAAVTAAQRAMQEDPFDPQAHHVMGAVHTHRGERQAAIEAFERAIELDPSHVHSYTSLGQALAMDGRPAEGIPMIERALRLSPNDPLRAEFLSDLGLAHFAAGANEEAIRHLEQSSALREPSPGNGVVLCAAYALAGRNREARQRLVWLLRRAPGLTLEVAREGARRLAPSLVEPIVEGLRSAGLEG